ncbi:GUN4 domain-containing protein [Halomicronema sp. CCY15110]|uniref:GUN4 domain-containing protein n=1 Tax=Halomicronema sp. CCY15110 TaxID=2767773 RepID=UPI00195204D8|nr:GUN4 domain-containing protein [Halomicronema sp. CCY15110]
MSFIFISYSRHDQAYVSTLVQALQSHRLPIWIDDRIDYGSTWPKVIQNHLKQSSVFLVVMSPQSEDSHWVQCELSLALKLKKPIFPLLLEGELWLSVAAIQTVDVMDGKLPPDHFFETIRGYFPGKGMTDGSIQTESDTSQPTQGIGNQFRCLKGLLEDENWEEADAETARIMIYFSGDESETQFVYEDIDNFPCGVIFEIDSLWTQYSNKRFGFSVQREIWSRSKRKFETFSDKVGWRINGAWAQESELTYSLNAPFGHLPSLNWVHIHGWAVGSESCGHHLYKLFERYAVCLRLKSRGKFNDSSKPHKRKSKGFQN